MSLDWCKISHIKSPYASMLYQFNASYVVLCSRYAMKYPRKSARLNVKVSSNGWTPRSGFPPLLSLRSPTEQFVCESASVDLTRRSSSILFLCLTLRSFSTLRREPPIFRSWTLHRHIRQVRLHTESRNLTAFITHEGLFFFKRVCSGLAHASATFQQVMLKVLEDCHGIQFYLDDIIVYGKKTRPEHDENLWKVFSAISQAWMKLNHKGVFKVQEPPFLGPHLSVEGLALLPSR